MADPSGRPRRVSMAYILGFSNKPFKDPAPPPRPPQPSALTQMVTTPGGIVEWAASDGRKGKLTGTGKQRLTAVSLAKVPSEKRSVKDALGASGEGKGQGKKAGSNKAASKAASNTHKAGGDNEDFGAFGGLWGDTGAAAKEDEKTDGNDNSHGWTEEDDKKLMDWRNENANAPWAPFAEEIGKAVYECKDRFKQIKPANWKPNNVKGKGAGGGGNQKQGKKDKKQNQPQNQGKTQDGGKKEETSGGDQVNQWGTQNDAWGLNTGDTADAGGGNPAWGATDTFGGNHGGNKNDDSKDTHGWETANPNADAGNGGWNATFDGATDAVPGGGWAQNEGGNTSGGGIGATAGNGWDTNNAQNNNDNSGGTGGGNDQAWGGGATDWNTAPAPAESATKAASKAPTNKSASRPRSHHHSEHKSHHSPAQAHTAGPLELEVKPDETFSADDLRLVARILQQDYSLVWHRVSWRFRDKTGRTLHPDMFEKKITGHVEGKESERGSQRGK